MPLLEFLGRHPRLGDALALIAGAALPLAFAPIEWRVISVLAPAILFLLWLDVTPRRAFWRGYLFGLGQFGVGVSWVYNSIHLFGHAVAPLAAVLTALFIAFLALFPALAGWALRRFSRRLALGPLQQLALIPFGFALHEWVRGWLFTGFPWLLLGQAHVDSWAAGYLPVFGVYGTGLVIAILAAAVGTVLLGGRLQRWLAVGAVLLFGLAGIALGRLEWTHPIGEPLDVSIVQGNIDQAEKWRKEQFDATLELSEKLSRAHFGQDVIVWPESAIPATYGKVAENYLLPLADDAQRYGTTLVTGLFVIDAQQAAIYNSLVALGPQQDVYHKRHLVPFGEYTPLRSVLGWLDQFVTIPMSDLDRGTGRPLLKVGDYWTGASICYEDAFGEEVIEALPEAAYLVNVSNDAWFGDSLAPWQHLELAQLRALETGRWMVRATNTGVSAIVDPRGRIAAISPQFERHVLSGQIEPRAGMTPYASWGNWPPVVVALLVLGLVAGLRWRR